MKFHIISDVYDPCEEKEWMCIKIPFTPQINMFAFPPRYCHNWKSKILKPRLKFIKNFRHSSLFLFIYFFLSTVHVHSIKMYSFFFHIYASLCHSPNHGTTVSRWVDCTSVRFYTCILEMLDSYLQFCHSRQPFQANTGIVFQLGRCLCRPKGHSAAGRIRSI
jgi:hypothetical protein